MKIKPEPGTERNYSNKKETLSVKQLIKLLKKYDGEIPVLMDTDHASYFVRDGQLREGWLYLVRPPGGR